MQFSLSGRAVKLWQSYERQLVKSPVPTQMATSFLLWGLGDMMAQKVVEQRPKLELRRLGLTACFGASFMGPVGHFWYIGLDEWCSRAFTQGTRRFFFAKVVLDSLILGPAYVLAFYAWGAMVIDGSGVKGFTDKVKKDFLSTFAAEMSIWPLFQAVNFTRVPVEHQLLFVNFATLLDASFLSWARTEEDWVGTLQRNVRSKLGMEDEVTQPSIGKGHGGSKTQEEGSKKSR